MAENKFPTEVLDLPSRGWFYPVDNPLSSGQIEIKYMGAHEEDILTSTNLVKKGVALDMVLRSVIVSSINYDSLLIGDKNAIMVATRILGYGKDYQVQVECPKCETKSAQTIDLSILEHKQLDFDSIPKGVNEFPFELPVSKNKITLKFMTNQDEVEISEELKGLKKLSATTGIVGELTTRLKHLITSVNSQRDMQVIRKFVDNELIAADSFAIRRFLVDNQPDIDMNYEFTCPNPDCGHEERLRVPLTVEFFWPGGQR